MNGLQVIDTLAHYVVNLAGAAMLAVLLYGIMRLIGYGIQATVRRRQVRVLRAEFGVAGKPIEPPASKRSHRRAA